MRVQPLEDHDQAMPAPAGHAIGFVDSEAACDQVLQALVAAGFPESTIRVLSGEDGVHLLKRSMGGSLWGEAAEAALAEGVLQLNHGHFVLFIDTRDRNQAMTAANIAKEHGGHGFSHFGLLMDERLTK
jgi:hypothetical protein